MVRLGMLVAGAGAVGIWGGDLTAVQGYGICLIISGAGLLIDPSWRKAVFGSAQEG